MFNKMNLFSKSSVRLLRFLVRNSSEHMYEREIARGSGVSVGSTNQHLREFTGWGIVHRERRGRMYFYTINLDNVVVRQFKILFNLMELEPLIERIKVHSSRVILFGSCAEGMDTEHSDIDLLILTEEKKRVREEVSGLGSKIDRRVSSIIVNSDDFLKLKKKDKPLYDRITRGIEVWRV